jgi:hypothetical protein
MPHATGVPYDDGLISTCERNELQLARDTRKALAGGNLVWMAVDGGAAPAGPRVDLAGQSIGCSDFPAKVALASGVPTLFWAPRWQDGMIVRDQRPLPVARRNECRNDFVARWRAAFLGHLRDGLCQSPENLCLAGGMWRHVRV